LQSFASTGTKANASATKHEAASDAIHSLAEKAVEPSGPLARRYRHTYRAAHGMPDDDMIAAQANLGIPRLPHVGVDAHLSEVREEWTLEANEAKEPEEQSTSRLRQSTATASSRGSFAKSSSVGTPNETPHMPPISGRRRRPHSCKETIAKISKISKEPCFDVVCGIMVLLNAVMIGAETEYMTYHHGMSHIGFVMAQLALNVWFTVELTLRIIGDNCRVLSSPDWKWHLFDGLLVCFSVVDVVQVAFVGVESVMVTGRLMRIIRLSRVVRTLRFIRTLNYIHQFRKMLYSLSTSITTLLWSLLLLFSVMFAFSVLFVQGVAEFTNHAETGLVSAHPDNVRILHEHYGSLLRGCLTLYKAISNGVSWGNVMDPLTVVDNTFIGLFLAYISIVFFGVLNVVSAVFVESAMASQAHYKDLRIYESRKAKTELVRHMKEVFRQIDEDGSGEISFEEMDHFLTDPKLKEYVESLEISVEDTAMLFQLMDDDDSGVVDIEEFCSGLMRLQGDAKSFDVQLLIFEMNKFQKRWDKFVTYVELMFDAIIEQTHCAEQTPRVEQAHSGQETKRVVVSSVRTNTRLSTNAFFMADEDREKPAPTMKQDVSPALLEGRHSPRSASGISDIRTDRI